MRILRNIIIVISILLIAVSVACIRQPAASASLQGNATQTTTSKPSGPTAQEILDRSSAKMKDVKSVHFRLEMMNGKIALAPGITLDTVEGDAVAPGQTRITTNVTAFGLNFEVQVITVDGKQYVLQPLTNRWQVLDTPAANTNFFDPAIGVVSIMKNVKNPTKAQNETIDGVDSYHIQGTLEASAVSTVFGGTPATGQVQTDLWIGTNDSLVRQIRLTGPVLQGDSPDVVRTLKLSKFNEPVSIEAPDVSP